MPEIITTTVRKTNRNRARKMRRQGNNSMRAPMQTPRRSRRSRRGRQLPRSQRADCRDSERALMSLPPSLNPNTNYLANTKMSGPVGRYTNGTMMYGDFEKWSDTNTGVNNLIFAPGMSGLPRLDTIASNFELWRLRSAEIVYVSAVGTNVNGILHFGVDYDPGDLPATSADVLSLNPITQGTVYNANRMMVQTSKVNRAVWMYTSGLGHNTHPDLQKGFALSYVHTSSVANVGELWVRYVVEISNPTKGASSALDVATALSADFCVGGAFDTTGQFNLENDPLSVVSIGPNLSMSHTGVLNVLAYLQPSDYPTPGLSGLLDPLGAAFFQINGLLPIEKNRVYDIVITSRIQYAQGSSPTSEGRLKFLGSDTFGVLKWYPQFVSVEPGGTDVLNDVAVAADIQVPDLVTQTGGAYGLTSIRISPTVDPSSISPTFFLVLPIFRDALFEYTSNEQVFISLSIRSVGNNVTNEEFVLPGTGFMATTSGRVRDVPRAAPSLISQTALRSILSKSRS